MYTRRIISVAGGALSVAVCVFITYISRDVDLATLLFNLGFLAVMLAMIAASCLFGLFRLIRAEGALQKGTDAIRANGAQAGAVSGEDGTVVLFGNSFLDGCYQQYLNMMKRNPNGGCDIQNFINEEVIEAHVHRSILESVPDILTSLGILGTFVGLVMGLREFDPSGYEQMAGSVTPLINGIKVAFITSIYGIALSLSFSFNLRSEFSNLQAKLDGFLDAFYLNVRPPYEVDSLSRLLERQKSQEDIVNDLTGIFVEQMATSFRETITPAFIRMTDGFQQVADSFTATQESLLTNVCETVTRQMRTELMADFDQINKAVSELTKTQAGYTDFMDRTILQMQKTLDSLQASMTQTQSYLTESVAKLQEAQGEAYRINQEQKEAYQDYIRFMYQSIEKFSGIWDKNSELLKGYSDELVRMGPVQSNLEMRNQLTKISDQLLAMQKSAAISDISGEDSSESAQETQELLRRTLEKLDELSDQVSRPRMFGRRKK